MIAFPEGLAGLVDELINLLDLEIELLDRRFVQLVGLSEATLEVDKKALEALLEQIEQTQHDQSRTDLKLQALRGALAEALDWLLDQLRLARLVEALSAPLAGEVSYRRQQIILLSDRLKQQHMETALVLTKCARVNRLLLESFFPDRQRVTTYGARGECSWGLDAGLVDVES